jgi:hypothetical protein
MTALNKAIADIPIPDRMKHLPISETGYPVPWFVAYDPDGKPQPTLANPDKIRQAYEYRKCWCCGQTLGRFLSFVIGPMCIINRSTSEPPNHFDCALYSVRACPFLSRPKMRRNPNKPEESRVPEGMIPRNPGVVAIWTTHGYTPDRHQKIFHLGEPVEVTFWREGRIATRVEIMESIESGLPILRDHAASFSRQKVDELELQYRKAMELVPA